MDELENPISSMDFRSSMRGFLKISHGLRCVSLLHASESKAKWQNTLSARIYTYPAVGAGVVNQESTWIHVDELENPMFSLLAAHDASDGFLFHIV